jgi:hypothetical protein
VRDQVELLVNNADAQRFNRRRIAERQRAPSRVALPLSA